jgi:hypothetical protein
VQFDVMQLCRDTVVSEGPAVFIVRSHITQEIIINPLKLEEGREIVKGSQAMHISPTGRSTFDGR